MKKSAITLVTLVTLAISLSLASAGDATKKIMKELHKPEDAICKKVGRGEATDADLATLLKAYQDMSGDTPAKGAKSIWMEKCQALISAIKKVQAKDASGTSDFKKAVNCKACHDMFKGK
jgi:uncharacterized protein YpmB